MTTFEDPEAFLEHYGVKGMRWGVRRERGSDGRVTGSEKRGAQQELRGVSRSARSTLREFNSAQSPAGRKKAADKYKEEVLKKIRSKEFEENYRKATAVTKGEMAVQVLLTGPMAAVTIPMMKNNSKNYKDYVQFERQGASSVLRELRART